MQLKALSICSVILSFLAYVAIGAPLQSTQLIERDLHTVHEAVHGISHHIGTGMSGSVYGLKDTYKGHHAVVKVLKPGEFGHSAPGPAAEAHNAHQAGQLLGHGHDPKTDTHYLVMKHMGESAKKHGVPEHDIKHLNDAANDRYALEHGIRNKDQNGNNFVYHNKNGHTQAEVVDWARTEHLGTHPKVAAMPVEHVHHTERRKCPTCVIQ